MSKTQAALNPVGKPRNGSKVLVLGVAYKKDIDDLRQSPALEILDLLTRKGAEVSYHDPYCPEIRDDGHTPAGAIGRSVELTDDALRDADAVIVVTDHSNVDYDRVGRLAQVLSDTRASTPGEVEASELIHAVGGAIAAVLTPHQRAVLVALTLNDVPIDVLAERRATTRGALYKTLHDARRKLRAELARDGFETR